MNELDVPKGFKFSVVNAGFRKKSRNDLALAVSDRPATAAACFTQAAFKAAPVLIGQEIIAAGRPCRAVMINSGQANACTGEQGLKNCRRTLELLSRSSGIEASEVLPASTGVIGNQFDMGLWEKAVPQLNAELGKCGYVDFANAIMTTDRFFKAAGTKAELKSGTVTMLGMAKGAGMICPNMATMLAVLLCDAEIGREAWQRIVSRAVELSFNRASVDGDTSTNDTIYALANGASGVAVSTDDEEVLLEAVTGVLKQLAYMLVQDGEGATKVMLIKISGAGSAADAEAAARTIGHSLLVKTAMFGQDPNWGRIIAALGRSGAKFRPDDVVLTLGGVVLFKNGTPVYNSDPPQVVDALKQQDIPIELSLGAGSFSYEFMASDLGHGYVTINADYRS